MALIFLARNDIVPADNGNDFLRLGPTASPAFVDTPGYQILREFRSGAALPTITLRRLLEPGTTPEAAGRVELIGVVADTVTNNVISPIAGGPSSEVPGVTLQGLFASQLLGHALDPVLPTRPLSGRMETALIRLCVLGARALALVRPPPSSPRSRWAGAV